MSIFMEYFGNIIQLTRRTIFNSMLSNWDTRVECKIFSQTFSLYSRLWTVVEGVVKRTRTKFKWMIRMMENVSLNVCMYVRRIPTFYIGNKTLYDKTCYCYETLGKIELGGEEHSDRYCTGEIYYTFTLLQAYCIIVSNAAFCIFFLCGIINRFSDIDIGWYCKRCSNSNLCVVSIYHT